MVITDFPVNIHGLGACAVCVTEKSVHLPHKDVGPASEFLEQFHIDIASPMPVASAGGRK